MAKYMLRFIAREKSGNIQFVKEQDISEADSISNAMRRWSRNAERMVNCGHIHTFSMEVIDKAKVHPVSHG